MNTSSPSSACGSTCARGEMNSGMSRFRYQASRIKVKKISLLQTAFLSSSRFEPHFRPDGFGMSEPGAANEFDIQLVSRPVSLNAPGPVAAGERPVADALEHLVAGIFV